MELKFDKSTINGLLDKAEPGLAALGFTVGATGEDIAFAQASGTWDAYTLEQKIKLVLNKLVVRTTGQKIFQDVATGGQFTFNPMGFLNKFLAIWVAGGVYEAFGLPHHTTVTKITGPLGFWGAVGGLFDPPINNQIPLNRTPPPRISAGVQGNGSWYR